MADDLLRVLQTMKETQLTRQVILPLIRSMYPAGHVEETHGSIEDGRDLICFDKHASLNRNYVLCIQVKNRKITYGATGPYTVAALRTQVEQARRIGVVRENGDTVQPDEVWVISGHPFSAGHRKMSEQFLRDISLLSGKFIAGEELATLLRSRCAQLVQELESIGDSRVAQAIAWLSQHHESKAFGLRLERTLDDFHVKSRVIPSGAHSSALLTGRLEFSALTIAATGEIPYSETDHFASSGTDLVASDSDDEHLLDIIAPLVQRLGVPVHWVASIDDALLSIAHSEFTDPDRRGRPDADTLPVAIERSYTVGFDKWAKAQRSRLSQALRTLPAILEPRTCERVAASVKTVAEVERALAEVLPACDELRCVSAAQPPSGLVTTTLQIADERLLLTVAPHLLVQGAPGAGKTTFSRRLAVSLLRDKVNVLFVSCASITPDMRHAPLHEIVKACAAPGTPTGWHLGNSVVIVDGLDEAPFDLSDAVLASTHSASRGLIATARAAFPTRLRTEFATLEISGFTPSDRDAFFANWFRNDPKRLDTIERLLEAHPDIEAHTRLPLIATLVAALVENEYTPTTRSEIYSQRLELLLEKWEAVKGLHRSTVPRKVQLRFLKRLAFNVHSRKTRSAQFGFNELGDAFAVALGKYGDRLDPEQFVRNLVFVSGVLQADGDKYTFGHLSFQEHLTGWFLADHGYIDQVGEMLGDDWWSEVLKFFAGISEDITELIDWCESRGITRVHKPQLLELVAHAPHTASVAVQVLEAT